MTAQQVAEAIFAGAERTKTDLRSVLDLPDEAFEALAEMAKSEHWLVPYEEIKSSMRLALESAQIADGLIEEILVIVEDFAVNNLGDD